MRELKIREATADDAAALMELLLRLDAESDLLLYEPGERPADVSQLAQTLTEYQARPNSIYLLAFCDGLLAGYLWAEGGRARRRAHSSYLAIAVDTAFHGRGVGRALMTALTEWADRSGVLRLELVVHINNAPARALYKAMGFVEEGRLRNYFRMRDGAKNVMYLARVRDDAANAGQLAP